MVGTILNTRLLVIIIIALLDTASLSVSQGMRKLKALRNRVRETRFDSNPLPTQHQQVYSITYCIIALTVG